MDFFFPSRNLGRVVKWNSPPAVVFGGGENTIQTDNQIGSLVLARLLWPRKKLKRSTMFFSIAGNLGIHIFFRKRTTSIF